MYHSTDRVRREAAMRLLTQNSEGKRLGQGGKGSGPSERVRGGGKGARGAEEVGARGQGSGGGGGGGKGGQQGQRRGGRQRCVFTDAAPAPAGVGEST